MLEIRKNTFSRSYENVFFREFSTNLFKVFKEKNKNGLLIGSPECLLDERLQVDALLITNNVACIIDFKNYSGKIVLPSEDVFDKHTWKGERDLVIKGGSFINPASQLKFQKKNFIDAYNKGIKKYLINTDKFNPTHLVRIVCFQNNIELYGRIPSKEQLSFFIVDKNNYLAHILDIIDVTDKEIMLSEGSFKAFKRIFRGNLYDHHENEDLQIKETNLNVFPQDRLQLYPDQKKALEQIDVFINDPSASVFSLKGSSNSGKSFLIPFIQELAYKNNIEEVELFGSSARVTQNLMSQEPLKPNSLYSYIYGGQALSDDEQEESIDTLNEETTEILNINTVPLRNCDNSENALFIIDEAQLVTDSIYQTFDLRFGSGKLLKDLLQFIDLATSNRKIIFLGDPFLLNYGDNNESVFNQLYLEQQYQIHSTSYELEDKEEFSEINKEALKCVRGIRNKFFSSINFIQGNHLMFIKHDDVQKCLSDLLLKDCNVCLLAFSNEEALKFNDWIKHCIVNTGPNISSGDLVLFHNNILVEDPIDPFAKPQKIYNGQFGYVISVSDGFQITKKIKTDIVTLNFLEIEIRIKGKSVKILSLENFRFNAKAQLSKNEQILFNISLSMEVSNERKKQPFESSIEYQQYTINQQQSLGAINQEDLKLLNRYKRKYVQRLKTQLQNDPSSRYYKIKNSALLKYGWSMTVHRAMSFKWDHLIFDVDPGANNGRKNENYYRALYTGISRARKDIKLINFKRLWPFDETSYNNRNHISKIPEYYISDNSDKLSMLLSFRKYVESKIRNSPFSITKIDSSGWQEHYTFMNDEKVETRARFSYNKKGCFSKPVLSGKKDKNTDELLTLLNKNSELNIIRMLDDWRTKEYTSLKNSLSIDGLKIKYILQEKFQDKIAIFSDSFELVVEMVYNGSGNFTHINSLYYDDESIWEKFLTIIQTL